MRGPSATGISFIQESYVVNTSSSPKSSALITTGGSAPREVQSSSSGLTSEISNTSSNRSDLSMNIIDEPVHEDMHDPIDFGQYFEEGYCKASSHNEGPELTEAITDVESSNNSPCDKEKSEEDGDNDDMLGGVFAFSEEGRKV